VPCQDWFVQSLLLIKKNEEGAVLSDNNDVRKMAYECSSVTIIGIKIGL
jgi:hypothetical protein